MLPFYRGFYLDSVVGAGGTLLRGLALDYADEAEDLCIDRVKAIPPAQVLLRANGAHGTALGVIHDAGAYRSIASSVQLGALVDGAWPDTRTEMLLRYLEFFGEERIQLMATAEARPGSLVSLRLEGNPGDEYLLAASLAEDYLPLSHGVCRLSPDHLFVLDRGVVRASGVVSYDLPVPPDEALLGHEIHLQALIGDKVSPPMGVRFTNREIVTVVE